MHLEKTISLFAQAQVKNLGKLETENQKRTSIFMRIAIVGGRDHSGNLLIFSVLDSFVKTGDTIVTGGAKGVDFMAIEWARKNHFELIVFEPKGKNKQDYLDRNQLIARFCDVLLAFPTINSKGTWFTIDLAKKEGKRVIVFPIALGV